MMEVIFTKYSNERDRRFAIRTDILEEDGERLIRKSALYPEGRTHLERLPQLEEKLNDLYTAYFQCNICKGFSAEEKECRLDLEYLEGETLEEYLDALLTAKKKETVEKELKSYLTLIQKIHSQNPFIKTKEFEEVFGNAEIPEGEMAASLMNIDMVCENLIRGEKPVVLDYEWTFAFPIPYKYLIYRIVFYYFHSNKLRAVLNEEAFYQEFGITQELKDMFTKMENRFQSYITGRHIPVRELYPVMTPGVYSVKMIGSCQLQVYFSFGEDYCEENSCFYPVQGEEVYAEISLPEHVKHVRIDPGNEPCSVQIHELSFDGTPAALEKAVIEKGFRRNNWVYIAKNDPGIAQIPVPEGSHTMVVRASIHMTSLEQMENIWNVEKENRSLRAKVEKMSALIHEMRETKVWKAYQSYRKLVEGKKNK